MANPFDQFDGSPAPVPRGSPAQPNPFDQFDSPTGSMPDFLFQQGPRANVLSAFGQGVEQGWGAEPLEFSDDTEQFLKKAGVYNDTQDGHQSWLRTFNEAMLRPAASALATGAEAIYRGVPALFSGLHAAAVEAAEKGQFPGNLAGGLAAAAMEGGVEVPPVFHGPSGAEPAPAEATAAAIRALTPPDLTEARGLGVIGEGEAGWKGITEPLPADAENARAAAIKQMRAAAPPEGEPATAPPAAPATAPDIHSIARQIAPGTFNEYDTLTQRRDTYRRWLDDLSETRRQDAETTAPNADQIADLQTRLQTANPRMTKIYQDRLDPLLEARDAYVADQVSHDSPDMNRVRAALQQNDYRMRDLAPDVSAAYREAQARLPPQETVPAAGGSPYSRKRPRPLQKLPRPRRATGSRRRARTAGRAKYP